jgi:hypothetical protein
MIMNQSSLPRFLCLLALATFSMFALTGAAPKPIHPPMLGTGGPILIAVVGDHYLAGDEEEFNQDVKNFLTRGLLLDPYYKEHKDDWRFVSYFQPTAPGKESRYGFKIGFGEGNCAVLDDQDPAKTTMALLTEAVGTDAPRHTIVIGNHRYNFGCSKNDWTYVAVGAVGTDVLQHEFGHLIGSLWDEWVSPSHAHGTAMSGAATNAPPYFPPSWRPGDTRNCSPVGTGAPTTPQWHLHSPPFTTPFADALGCNQVAVGVIHPYDSCRMGASHIRKFCEVCKAEMDLSFKELVEAAIAAGDITDATRPDDLNLRPSRERSRPRFQIMNAAFVREQQPQPGAPSVVAEAKPVLKVIMRYNPQTRIATVIQMVDGSGQYVPNYRRSGEYMYEIKDGATLIDVGVIPDDRFQVRGARNGAPHVSDRQQEAELVLMVPGRTVASLAQRPLTVEFFKIPTRVTDRNITRANLAKVRDGGGFESAGGTKLPPPPKAVMKH